MTDIAADLVKDAWLVGGAALGVVLIILAMLYTVNRANTNMSPAIEPRLQHHIDAQQQYIVQMSSDHREERKADNTLRAIEHDQYLKVLEKLGDGMSASTAAVNGLNDIINTREREDSQLRNARHGELLNAVAAMQTKIEQMNIHMRGISHETHYPAVNFLRHTAIVHRRYGSAGVASFTPHYEPALV